MTDEPEHPRLFTCERCKQTFEQGWSDEEAIAESKATFGFYPGSEQVGVLCDDCYVEFMAWFCREAADDRP
jgi:hypothetical protein